MTKERLVGALVLVAACAMPIVLVHFGLRPLECLTVGLGLVILIRVFTTRVALRESVRLAPWGFLTGCTWMAMVATGTTMAFPAVFIMGVVCWGVFAHWRCGPSYFPLTLIFIGSLVFYVVGASIAQAPLEFLDIKLDRERYIAGYFIVAMFCLLTATPIWLIPRSSCVVVFGTHRAWVPYLWIITLLGFLVHISQDTLHLQTTLGAITQVPYVVASGTLALLGAIALRLRSVSMGLGVVGIVVGMTAYALITGRIAVVAPIIIVLVGVVIYVHRSVPATFLLLTLPVFLLAQEFKTQQRVQLEGEGGYRTSPVELFKGAVKSLQFIGANWSRDGYSEAAGRLALPIRWLARLGTESMELAVTKSFETLQTAPLMFIPRFLWSGKPTSSFGNELGHRYGIIGNHDLVTSVNMPLVVEGFLAGGIAGVIVVGFLWGLILLLIGRLRMRRTADNVLIGGMSSVAILQALDSDSTTYLPFVLLAPLMGLATSFILGKISPVQSLGGAPSNRAPV